MKNSQKIIFLLSILWLVIIVTMGGWWLYLMNYLAQKLTNEGITVPNIIRLTKWEGSAFLILILLVTSTIYYYYYRVIQKTQALQSFFASLTHELKTPLASIRLQGEVIKEMAEEINNESLGRHCDRLTNDTNSLETQMDKVLQLSQIDKGVKLSLQEINFSKFLESKLDLAGEELTVNFNDLSNGSARVQIDPFAFDLIIKNLFENTKRHSIKKKIDISLFEKVNKVELTYTDYGKFQASEKKIGKIFSKGKSSKGSGIGLFLITNLMKAMQGDVYFEFEPYFKITLSFKRNFDS